MHLSRRHTIICCNTGAPTKRINVKQDIVPDFNAFNVDKRTTALLRSSTQTNTSSDHLNLYYSFVDRGVHCQATEKRPTTRARRPSRSRHAGQPLHILFLCPISLALPGQGFDNAQCPFLIVFAFINLFSPLRIWIGLLPTLI